MRRVHRARVSASLAAALLSVLVAAQAASPTARKVERLDAPVVLKQPTLVANWHESWLTGRVEYSGTVAAASELTVYLKPAHRPGPVASAKQISLAAAGPFSGALKLPPGLRPGVYRLYVGGSSDGVRVRPVHRDVTLSAPPEGIVDIASASATKGGAGVPTIRGPRRELWARFHFLVPPRSGMVHVAWHSPSFRWRGVATKPYKSPFDTFVLATAPEGSLERGVWFCYASSSGRVVKRVRIRIA